MEWWIWMRVEHKVTGMSYRSFQKNISIKNHHNNFQTKVVLLIAGVWEHSILICYALLTVLFPFPPLMNWQKHPLINNKERRQDETVAHIITKQLGTECIKTNVSCVVKGESSRRREMNQNIVVWLLLFHLSYIKSIHSCIQCSDASSDPGCTVIPVIFLTIALSDCAHCLTALISHNFSRHTPSPTTTASDNLHVLLTF